MIRTVNRKTFFLNIKTRLVISYNFLNNEYKFVSQFVLLRQLQF